MYSARDVRRGHARPADRLVAAVLLGGLDANAGCCDVHVLAEVAEGRQIVILLLGAAARRSSLTPAFPSESDKAES